MAIGCEVDGDLDNMGWAPGSTWVMWCPHWVAVPDALCAMAHAMAIEAYNLNKFLKDGGSKGCAPVMKQRAWRLMQGCDVGMA